MKTIVKLVLPIIILVLGLCASFALLVRFVKKGNEAQDADLFYTVTYVVGEYAEEIPPEIVAFNERPSLPTPKPCSPAIGDFSPDWLDSKSVVSIFKGAKTSYDDEEYIFLGWYTSAGVAVQSSTFSSNKDITIYAHWKVQRSYWTSLY